MKPTVTGYMNRTIEGGKFENLIYCQQGSVYYLPSFGTDRRLFIESDYPIQAQSFASYLAQVAMVNGIATNEVSISKQDFALNIHYEIAGIEQDFGGINF